MIKNKMNISILVIYILITILIAVLQYLIIGWYPIILEDESIYITFSSSINLLLYVSIFVLFIVLFKTYLAEQLRDLLRNKTKIAAIIVIGFILMIIASVVSSLLLEYFGVNEASENQAALDLLLEGTLYDKIALFTFSVLLAPLVEEFVFRKAILNLFHFKHYDKDNIITKIIFASIALLVSSFAFGFIHVMSGDFIQIIFYSFLGLVLGILYLVSNKNIYVPIIGHFLYNLLIISIIFLEL